MSFAENFGMQRFISPSINFDEIYGNEMSRQAMLDSFRMAGENPAIGYLANAQRAKYAAEAAKIAAQVPDKPHGANQFLSNASGLMSMASGVKGALGGLGGGGVGSPGNFETGLDLDLIGEYSSYPEVDTTGLFDF